MSLYPFERGQRALAGGRAAALAESAAKLLVVLLVTGAATFGACAPAYAQSEDEVGVPTASDYGGIGLIEMRNARFMPDGDISILGTVKTPDDRVALSFQALPWLETTFRYTINYALKPVAQRALYDRSFDLKARLFRETDDFPAVAIGIQDILGTGVYSSEYLVASKSFGDFDTTLGMGWGRLASRPAFGNPLGLISNRFYSRPTFSGQGGTPLFNSLFRGKNVGLFGGIEYRTPVPNLTFKVEYSSDAYTRESDRQHVNYAPFPVNVGLSYRLWSNVDIGVSYIGGKEVAATLNIFFDPNAPNFPTRVDRPDPFVARNEDVVNEVRTQQQIASGAQGDEPWRVHFVDLATLPAASTSAVAGLKKNDAAQLGVVRASFDVVDQWVEGHTEVVQIDPAVGSDRSNLCARTLPELSPIRDIRDVAIVGKDWNPLAFCKATQVGAPLLAQATQEVPAPVDKAVLPDVTIIEIERMRKAISDQNIDVEAIGAHGSVVVVDIENAHYLRDAEAIARTARALSGSAPPTITAFQITTMVATIPVTRVTIPRTQVDALGNRDSTPAELWNATILEPSPGDIPYPNGRGFPRFSWSVEPSIIPSTFDPDNPVYIGLGVSAGASVTPFRGLTLAGEATYSIYNNFGDIRRSSNSVLPHVRTDIAQYLKKGASGIDSLTLSYTRKLSSQIYAKLSAGYIESMYAGVGGEILYRPFGERWAVGVDLWDVRKRNFDRLFGLQHYETVTGNVTLYFQTPYHGFEGYLSVGRYLAKDYGATLEFDRRFESGIKIGAWMTITNVSPKRFGEGSFDKGIRIVIPIEWALPFASQTAYRLDLRPIQRDGGQALDNTRTLYDATQSSSYGEIERQWSDVFE